MSYHLDVTNADCYEGTTTLINKLGITDENELKSSEALITAYKAASLINEPLAPNFGFENYKELHKVLFDDLYDWAGKPRTIALSKTATVFTAPERIEELGSLIFARLKKLDYFTKLSQKEFVSEIAELYHSLNMLHPFREGNGRTERVFFVQFIRNARYDIDYSTLNSDLLMIGGIQAASGVMDTLVKFSEENIVSR
ncbi:MAG: Fic/DOC family protein [Oscillospiraceae bacterium]